MARRPDPRVVLTGVVALVAALGCRSPAPVAEIPTDWETDRALYDQLVEARETYAQANPRAWLRTASLAETYAERARHTGDLTDFAAAEVALEDAFEQAAEGSGPVLAQARLDLSLHRFDTAIAGAEQALGAILVSTSDQAAARSIVGRAALELGDVARAGGELQRAHELDPTSRTWADLAVWHTATGDLQEAELAWDEARATCLCAGSRFDGWVALQRGLVPLDAGDPAEALPWFELAMERYSGDWVFQEHAAEALAATGRLEEADALYATAIATVRDPEVLAAWAEVRRELGDPAGADALIREARIGFLQAEAMYPEAMSAHASAFFEAYGR